jgi:hypothetical protein
MIGVFFLALRYSLAALWGIPLPPWALCGSNLSLLWTDLEATFYLSAAIS